MRRILVLEDRQEHFEKIQNWVDRNYPGENDAEVVWMDDVSNLSSRAIAQFDVIIFTGTVGGIQLAERFKILKKWNYRIFVYHDSEVSTRQMLVKLRHQGIQTFGIS